MAVAEVAERLDHHPDVDLRYRTVRLRLRSCAHHQGVFLGSALWLSARHGPAHAAVSER